MPLNNIAVNEFGWQLATCRLEGVPAVWAFAVTIFLMSAGLTGILDWLGVLEWLR